MKYVLYIKDKCIKNLCNAYAEHFKTKIITLQDKIDFQNSDIDWEYNLISDGWTFKSGSKSCCGPDNQDSLYIKKSEVSNLGRCLMITFRDKKLGTLVGLAIVNAMGESMLELERPDLYDGRIENILKGFREYKSI